MLWIVKVTDAPNKSDDQPSPPRQPSVHEIIQAKIACGELPNWKVVHGRGKGFVIGVVQPPKRGSHDS